MGTKNSPGQFDCYAAAEPDEQMFVLLARDKHAPTLVRLWALLRARDGEDEEKVKEALMCAEVMESQRRLSGRLPMDSSLRDELFATATKGMDCHPEDFDLCCDCDTCRSYA